MTRRIDLIVVHCAATKPSMDIGVKEIDRWHRERGFLKIGYHFVIRRNGKVEHGRSVMEPGAHASGHNANSIGICLVGGIDDKGKPEENYTDDQYASLAELLINLQNDYPGVEICGHRDLPRVNKACPSFDVRAWMKETGIE